MIKISPLLYDENCWFNFLFILLYQLVYSYSDHSGSRTPQEFRDVGAGHLCGKFNLVRLLVEMRQFEVCSISIGHFVF